MTSPQVKSENVLGYVMAFFFFHKLSDRHYPLNRKYFNRFAQNNIDNVKSEMSESKNDGS